MSENDLAPGTFVKVYGGILKSTVWVGRPYYVKLVWLTMLVEADAKGFVASSVIGLAKDAEVTPEQCREALHVFLSPDPESRTKEHEGRRIVEVDGGWRLLNHKKYRDMRTPQQVDAARRQKKVRDLRKAKETGTGNVTRVTRVTRNAGHAKTVTSGTNHASHNRSRSSRPDQNRSGSGEQDQPARPDLDPIPPPKIHPEDSLGGIPEDPSGSARASPGTDLGTAVGDGLRALMEPAGGVQLPPPIVMRVDPIIASRTCPAEWQPNDGHRARAAELGLDFDAELEKFRVHEWERPYTDWDRRFHAWLIKARNFAQTEAFQRQTRGGGTLQPNHGRTGFEDVDWNGS